MECRVSHSGNDETHWRLKSTSSLTIYPKLQFEHLHVSINFHLLMHMTSKDVKKKVWNFILKKRSSVPLDGAKHLMNTNFPF